MNTQTLFVLVAAITYSLSANANPRDAKAFPSDITELTVQNASFVGATDTVIRGAAPLGKADELAALGVTDVIIFKNQTRGEVDQEVAELEEAGVENIHHFNFAWKDVANQQAACEQTVNALKVMIEVAESSDRKVFFHCTAGQDRTGHLAGLYRLMTEDITREQAIEDELCANGYSEGNKGKPSEVVYKVNESISPLFLKMASMIVNGKLSADNLDTKVCKSIRVSKKPIRLCK
jgi:hypothetical protein